MKKAFDELFIEGTARIVAQVGIENVRTKQIADYAGFSEATLFRSFGTKEEILRRTFLYIDRKVSTMFSDGLKLAAPDHDVMECFHTTWHTIFRYLLSHKDETTFLLRYRYSSLFTDEVRASRHLYRGDFDKAHELFMSWVGPRYEAFREFVISFMFESTLCFAERIISGKISDTRENEDLIWALIASAITTIIEQGKEPENDR